MHKITALAASLLLATLVSTGAVAAEPPSPEAADQVVVRYRAGTSKAQREEVARAYGLTKVHGTRNGRTEVLVGKGRSTATIRRQLAKDPNVIAASLNSWRDLDGDPTEEPFFEELWGIHNTGQSVRGIVGTPDIDIDGLEALQFEKGRSDVPVAVIDDGVDFFHPDLYPTQWINHGESGYISDPPGYLDNNGIDDDGNGYVDDVYGWDFCNNDNTVGPANGDSHGTHVAGTIGADSTGLGMFGVAPGIAIMSLRAFSDGSSCAAGDAAIIAAIDYAGSFGVRIINASWSGPEASAPLDTAIEESGALFVAAAGNYGANMDGGGTKQYPAASLVANVLSVAAIDQSGRLADFSNYGATSVDIAAPGTNILSTIPPRTGCNPCWAYASGTSMAAPHVAGVAGLALSRILSTDGTLPSTSALRSRILATGVPLASTAGKTVTGKLVNSLRAMDTTGPVATPINRHGFNVGTIVGSTVSTTMTWPAATDTLTSVKSYLIKRSLDGGAWTTLITSITTRSYKRAMSFGTPTRFQLYARDVAGNLGKGAVGPTVTATLLQDGTSIAKYTGKWSNVNLSSASGGRMHRSTTSGSTVTFTTSARAIAVIGRRGPLNGQAKVYVDGVYKSTIDLRRSSYKSRVLVFNTSWNTTATHSVKLVVVGGTGRVDIDAFAFLR